MHARYVLFFFVFIIILALLSGCSTSTKDYVAVEQDTVLSTNDSFRDNAKDDTTAQQYVVPFGAVDLFDINEDYILVEQDTILYTDAVVYDSKQVQLLLASCPSIDQLQERFDSLLLKSLGNLLYTVIKTSDSIYWVAFNADGSFAKNELIEFSSVDAQKSLEKVKAGDSLESVMRADDQGNYNFIYANWSEYPQISYHFFENGNCYMICYKNRIVTDIYSFTI